MHVSDVGVQQTSVPMQRMLYIAGLLVFLVGIQLFILSEQTAQFFAWTINPPLTAAFLGAAYWASCAIEIAAARQVSWARARIAVPSVLIFTTLTLIVSLVHLDRFHLGSDDLPARTAAWVWLAVYALVPPALALLLLRQLRLPGTDLPRIAPMPAWVIMILGTHAVLLILIGLGLLIDPLTTRQLWPWELTPLTGRAIGAWALALGIAATHTIAENDWPRVHVATISYTVFGILEVIALARYPASFFWNTPQGWIFLIFLASVLLVGIYGWRTSLRYLTPGATSRPMK
ncbi:MAG TPA: hypothetical protein PKA05_08480 [Roseiflexaceae bacterium]|nr:hypothetical protein [Roseiflexaceae bacterium]HMP40401.1 hypothetical protein [Roseiflexaceae bacterium]